MDLYLRISYDHKNDNFETLLARAEVKMPFH